LPVIAIISQKGGASKTTLAVHLAEEAKRRRKVALVIDTDPQASAYQWGIWRKGVAPEVIDSAPPLIADKVAKAQEMGAQVIIIDTPPHGEAAAIAAAKVADIILIPCRPSALDLHSIRITADLASRSGKPSFVIFTGGNPNAKKLHAEAAEIVKGYGMDACPHIMAERADYRNSTGAGMTAFEFDPKGRAAEEVAQLWQWIAQKTR
jgi:chromosome partitioning protein